MKRIYKYTLKPSCSFEMPIGAKILSVHEQYGEARMWAMVDTDNKIEARKFRSYGTGHPMPDNPGDYIGTFLIENGSLVFHVFEEK